MKSMRVYIGWDAREAEAYDIAKFSLLRHASIPVDVMPLNRERLQMSGLMTRPADTRRGFYDLPSNAPAATDFAISRFFVPLLAHSGLALFVDCDVVFTGDVAELVEYGRQWRGVHVVKHHYKPQTERKMDDQPQTVYARKNWSSVMLFNCDHPAHARLTLQGLNNWPGRYLHGFGWLHDNEIGELEPGWNWLVDEQARPDPLKLAHYTLGGPWIPGWISRETDALWIAERKRWLESKLTD